MKTNAIFLSVLIGVLGLLTAGVVSAQGGSGHDFVFLLDEFRVFGPGAWEPGWFDDFNDGDLGGWVCYWGTCQDEFGTSYARLESPGSVYHYPGWPSFERSDIASWNIPESYVSADGWFQGIATFAAELPDTNESISLVLAVGPFDRDGDGTMFHDLIIVSIENPTLEIAAIYGHTSVGLHVHQNRQTYDENWDLLSSSDWELEQLTAPDVLGDVILSFRYDEEAHVFHAGYSLTESPEVLEPFNPIHSNLHLSVAGSWTIGARFDFLNVGIDIKPGSDPNCFNLNGHGVIPVAINGSADFDVYDVDLDTLLFDGLQVRVRGNKGPLCSIKDWNSDGILDLVCHFEDDPGNWTGGDSTATLTGNLLDGTTFAGTDSICIVP